MFERIFSLDTIWWVLLFLYVPACIGLIVIVLLQKGKGTGFAGAFGVGPGSDAVFGPKAGRSLPVRLTYIAAAMFMVIALLMSLISGRVGKGIAPELVDTTDEELTVSSGLGDLGIGTGEAGAAFTEEPRAPETAPASDEGADTDEAAVEMPPDAPGEAAAPTENSEEG